jgi:hypothetical protein
MFAVFGPYGYLLAGALVVGIVGLILTGVVKRKDSH